jgi:hypothetical protein
MKRAFLLLALPLLIFSSCKKEVTEVQQVDQAFSAIYTINPADWKTTNGGTSYYEALPQVFDGITYGVIHGDGYVSVDISTISGNAVTPPGEPVTAKIILIDATKLALKKDVNLRDMQAVQKAFNIN